MKTVIDEILGSMNKVMCGDIPMFSSIFDYPGVSPERFKKFFDDHKIDEAKFFFGNKMFNLTREDIERELKK